MSDRPYTNIGDDYMQSMMQPGGELLARYHTLLCDLQGAWSDHRSGKYHVNHESLVILEEVYAALRAREKLRQALEPFAINVDAVSLSKALGHITREHLLAARAALNQGTSEVPEVRLKALDEAIRHLRLSISITDIEKQRSLNVIADWCNDVLAATRAQARDCYRIEQAETELEKLRAAPVPQVDDARGELLARRIEKIPVGPFAILLGMNDDLHFKEIVAARNLIVNALRAAPAQCEPSVTVGIGRWLSAALDDPQVCEEMKADIRAWFDAGEPVLHQCEAEPSELSALADEIERGDGLYSMNLDSGGYQLGIKRTAQVVAALRAAPAQCDAGSARPIGAELFRDAVADSAVPPPSEPPKCRYCNGTGKVELTVAERNALSDIEMKDALSRSPRVLPKALHWLGDRESADATRHALDMTGCVAYFEQQSDCVQFMRWLESLSPDPGTVQ